MTTTTLLLEFCCAILVIVPILCTRNVLRTHPPSLDPSTPSTNASQTKKSSTPRLQSRPMTDGTDTPTSTSPSASRKPWDPPFPVSSIPRSKEKQWLVLPPSEQRHTRTCTLSPAASEHEDIYDDIQENPRLGATAIHEPDGTTPEHSRAALHNDEAHATTKDSKPIMSIVSTVLACLVGMLLALGTAVLTIYCLAWFIVYHTEARLGEARRGLLSGGEMRLCLCGRG
ncbi:hypothetical protein EK21DRAFT_114473 [Setomelanomma holmii]|uniref:Uncharacterized protein n=1 Tax=Setomelanomma holmii TaxID=210430 RepID=A0A9P4H419_9PLEO|nr:hypothetical protein EK21DRAFT_114473 [Setomelanomma holmii]